MSNCGVYLIENKVTGDCYFGQSVNVVNRKKCHFHLLRNSKHSNNHLQRAWNKYGESNFDFQAIIICEPSELTRYEQACVDKLKSTYNIKRECVVSNFGLKMSKEAKEKISRASKGNTYCLGMKHSAETKAKMSKMRMGHTTSKETRGKISVSNTGKHPTDQTKVKLSFSHLGKHSSKEAREKVSASLIGNKRRLGKIPGNSKLKEQQVLEIINIHKSSKLTHSQISEMFGVTKSEITHILSGLSWNNLTGIKKEI